MMSDAWRHSMARKNKSPFGGQIVTIVLRPTIECFSTVVSPHGETGDNGSANHSGWQAQVAM